MSPGCGRRPTGRRLRAAARAGRLPGTGGRDQAPPALPARPIKVGGYLISAAITPDGKTVYVTQDYSGPSGTVTPISTAAGVPGRPIRLGGEPVGIGIAPDGKTAYVACLGTPRDPGTVVPISTATNTGGRRSRCPWARWRC